MKKEPRQNKLRKQFPIMNDKGIPRREPRANIRAARRLGKLEHVIYFIRKGLFSVAPEGAGARSGEVGGNLIVERVGCCGCIGL